MRTLFAIFRQTVRAALRSKVFLVLLLLNLLAVFLLPLTVAADGTAVGQLQLTITYSLTAVTGLLSIAAVWLGCAGLAREIEAYNMHLVMSKPVRPWMVWLGKWLAVFVMTSVIFVVSAGLVYVLILWNLKSGKFTQEGLAEAQSEVLVGRRTFGPDSIDFEAIGQREYEQLLRDGSLAADHEVALVRREIVRQLKAQSTEVGPLQTRTWRFTDVKVTDAAVPVYFRYRLYLGSTSASNQRFARGVWSIVNPGAPAEERMAVLPQEVMSGSFHEFQFPASMVAPSGTVIVQYTNYDAREESVVFQAADGPVLMVRVTGFGINYARAMLVTILRLAVLSALGCAFGGALSTPVAVFVAISYLVLGAVVDATIGSPVRDPSGQIVAWKLVDMITHLLAQTVDKTIISFRVFDVTGLLSRGHLVEMARIARLLLTQVLLRGTPLALLGIWILSRRELGKVIRR